MAEEAFALSPISARAARPSEEDYDAISEAFMETSRGRWFLGEYAKRNRNTDTTMVLDAVARIEETLAAQRQPPPDDNSLAEALAEIRTAVDQGRTFAAAAVEGLSLEQHLAPVRKGARVIREIAWRLREIGADGRICDLIDSQVAAIEAGCGQISSEKATSELRAAFDLIEGRIAEFDDEDAAPAEVATPTAPETAEDISPAASPAPSPVTAAAVPTEAIPQTASAVSDDFEITMGPPVLETETLVTAEAGTMAAGNSDANPRAPAETATDMSETSTADADAHDEAVLDLIAMEMAAPDPLAEDEIYEIEDADETEAASFAAKLAAVDLEVSERPQERIPEPVAARASRPAIPAPAAPAPRAPVEIAPITPTAPARAPAPEPSLGSTLIANGIVRRPSASTSDPMAPIRRMSQAEKIAFFS